MQELKSTDAFYVYCVWCGQRIRQQEAEDIEATCLRCFYRILKEREQTRPHMQLREYASDR